MIGAVVLCAAAVSAAVLGLVPPGATAPGKGTAPFASRPGMSAARTAALDRSLKFAACMRTRGVPNFPDPKVTRGGLTMDLSLGTNPNSPQFKAARAKCQGLLSPGTAR